jgi:hypothetical protein
MARGQRTRKEYLNCTLGKWRQRVTSDHPRGVLRTTDKGNQVYEIVDDFVTGLLKKIYLEESTEYGDKWCLQVHDGNEILILQVSVNSGYTSALIPKLLNCDLEQPITFSPYFFDEEKKARMVLEQNGAKVGSFYTREDPKDFPPFPTTGDKDDLALWKIETNRFLKNIVETVIIPRLPDPATVDAEAGLAEATEDPRPSGRGGNSAPDPTPPPERYGAKNPMDDEPPDDLPF